MITLLFRTVIIYTALLITMRLMGKRQVGELELSDLVTTLLLSEIASLPITDGSIPVSHAIVPMIILLTFEVSSSALLATFPRIKGLMTARPTTLIRDGKLCEKAMRQARLSIDELIGELRQKDVTDLSEVRHAILEQNGKITVVLKVKHRPPTAEQLHLAVEDSGLYHIMIDKGVVNKHNLKELNYTQGDLNREIADRGLRIKDIYLMMINDQGDAQIIRKDEVL